MTTIAFIGGAHIHTPGFLHKIASLPDVRVTSVWDHDASRAAKLAAETGARTVASAQEICEDPSVDAIVVCSETNRHRELVLPAAASGKPLFVEKPLGFGTKDAYEMARAIQDAGIPFQTGYFMRGDPKNIFLKKQVEAGVFGKITRVRGSNCHEGALGRWFDTDWRWMADPRIAGVGAFGDLGTHSLDILLWMFGDIEKASALLGDGTMAYEGCDETGEGLLLFGNGIIGTLAAAWDDIANPVTLMISGTEGHAIVFNDQLYFKSKHIDGADGSCPWTDLPPSAPAGFDAFLDTVNGVGSPALVSAPEAAYRSAVTDALYQSAKSGKWEKPEPYPAS